MSLSLPLASNQLSAAVLRASAGGAAARQRPLALLPAQSDEDLVRRAQRGDRWAEEAIYRRYVGTIYGIAQRLLRHSADAEDVVQETFVTAFSIWNQLKDSTRLRQWLCQIAVRKVHRRFRKRRLLRALGLDRSIDDASLELLGRADLSHEARESLAALDRALGSLPFTERAAWMLRYVDGSSLEEVASQCDCSLATAKRRIAAARAVVARHVVVEESADE